jgi:hypothetical protein
MILEGYSIISQSLVLTLSDAVLAADIVQFGDR